MEEKLHHATITLERAYAVSVERVFSEFADPRGRAKWSAPSNEALVYDEGDFHEGSRDVFRCGPPNDLKFRGVTNDRLQERGHRIIELRVSIQDHIKIT